MARAFGSDDGDWLRITTRFEKTTQVKAHASSYPSPEARSVSVVIPCYNEEDLVEHTTLAVVQGLRDLDLDFFEVILSENGSRDQTRTIALRLAGEIEEVRTITSDQADYGAAMRAGFWAARGDVIVNFDADYYDLDFLRNAIRQDADIVVAAKHILGSHDARVVSRRVISRAFGFFVRGLLGVTIEETHGMKLFRRDSIAALLPQVRSTKDIFDTELIVRSEWAGLRIAALPISTVETRHSRSGIVRRIPRTIFGLLRLRYQSRDAYALRIRPVQLPAETLDLAV